MIGRLYGKIEYFSEDHLLIDVQGVGYVVYCSERTLRSLPAVGEDGRGVSVSKEFRMYSSMPAPVEGAQARQDGSRIRH